MGAELTSGQPDQKEGLYFGTELPGDDPRVMAGIPLHGANLFPRQVPRLRPLVLAYLDALASLGQAVLAGVAQSLGLDSSYFAAGYTADPTILFRIFHYPPSPPQAGSWGVGRATAGNDGRRRWDGQDLRAFTGTYGDYLLGKVSHVFPQLRRDVLE